MHRHQIEFQQNCPHVLRLPRVGLVRLAFHEEDEDQGHGGLLSKLGVLSSMIRNHHQLFNEDRDSEIINKNLSCLLQSMSKRLVLNNLVISKKIGGNPIYL